MRGNVLANPREYGSKCGGFLPVLRFPALQAVVPLGVVVGTWKGIVGDGVTVIHTAFFLLLLMDGRDCRTGTFRSFTIFSAFSFSSSSSFSVEEIFFLSFSFSFFIIYGCVCVACFKEIMRK